MAMPLPESGVDLEYDLELDDDDGAFDLFGELRQNLCSTLQQTYLEGNCEGSVSSITSGPGSAEVGFSLAEEDISQSGAFSNSSYYELRSTPVESSILQKEFSPGAMSTRTNFKQELMRQQIQDMDKREQSLPCSSPMLTSPAIDLPKLSTIPEVPTNVLKVTTKLENPTRYYIKQSQKRQVEQYLSASASQSRMSPHLLNCSPTSNSPSRKQSGSISSVPNSPMSTTQEVDDILDEVISLESSIGEDALSQYLQDPMPVHTYLDQLSPTGGMTPAAVPTQSVSCPADLNQIKQEPFQEQVRAIAKERQKKDNHNMIERRRRFNINDRIKELGTLIPKNIDPDQRQNKGTILKCSVDYIMKLQKEQTRFKAAEERQKKLQSVNRRMMLRIQELEMRCKQFNIPSTALSEETKTENIAGEFMRLQSNDLDLNIKGEKSEMKENGGNIYRAATFATEGSFGNSRTANMLQNKSSIEEMMDDNTLHTGVDPLLCQSSPIASLHSSRRSSLTSMDDTQSELPPSNFLS
ncbi:transcription factor EC-like isoform X2 [Asterias rubens]|uniref:transcription factor EC-like isoform X2 n=1 Tax=Asterias rubens TaxID=7604 RepID=UPI0014559F37|nr:transcription factor EC-like isoform X2 [Asterias rubens]